jgi:hypothetical protein
LRHVWANVGAWNLIGWWHTLVELWAWDQGLRTRIRRDLSQYTQQIVVFPPC